MEKKTFLESLEPTFEKIGELTKVQRYVIYFGTIILAVAAFIYLSVLPNQKKMAELRKQKAKIEKQLVAAKREASQLAEYTRKMEEAKVQFEIVKRTLPEKEDIPSLLTSISQAGRDAGLEFNLFQPNNEAKKNFYAEIPVSINVTGEYHNIAVFFDKVARLSRIVNIQNIKISGRKGSKLTTTCKAVTYRFLENK